MIRLMVGETLLKDERRPVGVRWAVGIAEKKDSLNIVKRVAGGPNFWMKQR
jgi:hypothetical protein